MDLGQEADIVIAEIGGTVGDMESEAFYEAARQMKQTMCDDVLVILVAPIIWNATVKELKTKPLQNSVKTTQMRGLQPDIVLCRTERPVEDSIFDKNRHTDRGQQVPQDLPTRRSLDLRSSD